MAVGRDSAMKNLRKLRVNHFHFLSLWVNHINPFILFLRYGADSCYMAYARGRENGSVECLS